MKIRYGTRGSPLALAQSSEVARRLQELQPSLESERAIIRTSGDQFAQAASAPAVKPANVKAMFVKEIEEALLSGAIDFAVHSAKDLPGSIPDGLEIAAYPAREDPRDVYIGGSKAPRWQDLPPGAVVGTSSLRRQIQLRLARPGIAFVPLRGNVDTRLKRLEEGKAWAIVLAKAGLKRLGRDHVPHEILPVEVMIPAPGQGALALEARSDRKDVLELLGLLENAKTRIEVECERLFLKAMGGGCEMPLGAHAQAAFPAEKNPTPSVNLTVFWSDAEGKNPIRRSGACGASPVRVASLVEEIASQIRKASDENGR